MWPFRRSSQPAVFHLTHYKAGSQWVYALLKYLQPDRIVAPKIGATHVLEDPIADGMIYPTVYATRQEFDRVPLPADRAAFFVMRDLRDTLVSFYFSLKFSHPLMTAFHEDRRRRLGEMSFEDGMRLVLDTSIPRSAAIQKSWLSQDSVPVFRYEELVSDTLVMVERIVDHCRMRVSRLHVKHAVDGCSFEQLTGGRPRGAEDPTSHFRKALPGDWRTHFTPAIKAEFKRRYGDLLIETGYETDVSW